MVDWYIAKPNNIYHNKLWNVNYVFQIVLHKMSLSQIAGNPSFIFIWCGSAEGLDMGRQCLRKWGFRRCEDICWIKTNKTKPGNTTYLEPKALFQHTKEHCLMGIKVIYIIIPKCACVCVCVCVCMSVCLSVCAGFI